jgi:Flp pilus assembly protein TadD
MQKTTKNIVLAIAVSVTLAGCQNLQSQGSSTNNGSLGYSILSKPIQPTELAAGKKHFKNANYGLAEKNFRKSVELHPTNAEAWLGLAASYDQLGLFTRSDRAYSQAIKLVGPKPAILNNQGYSQMLRGNKSQAGKLLRKAEAMAPENARIKGNLDLLRSA